MSVEVAIWRVDSGHRPVSLGGMDYEDRLEQIIEDDISIADPTLMVIGRQVTTAYGGQIDILAIDGNGSLVVIELKRDRTPRDVVAQALDYGSWVRQMTTEQISATYLDYQRRFGGEQSAKSIDEAMREKFNAIPDELNPSHRLVIVATELDPSTERIVSYLREVYGVEINVVFFRAFQDDGRTYLSRAWLAEPTVLSKEAPTGVDPRGEWNGEFYVSFGEGPHRRWNDAKKYGFVSAGGGEWYVRTLRSLQPGNRIWVSVPGKGYVGVGEVVHEAVRYDHFSVKWNGTDTPFTQLQLEAPDACDENHCEHCVTVKWVRAVDLEKAVRERGFFGNQNTVAQPRSPKWDFTVARLTQLWDVTQG